MSIDYCLLLLDCLSLLEDHDACVGPRTAASFIALAPDIRRLFTIWLWHLNHHILLISVIVLELDGASLVGCGPTAAAHSRVNLCQTVQLFT